MNISIFFSYGLILILFKRSISNDIIPFIKDFDTSDGLKQQHTETENTYVQSVLSNVVKEDVVCALSYEKKLELCRIISHLKVFQNFNFYMNKIPFYKTKLVCTAKELTFKYSSLKNKSSIVKQNMYLCFGRHKIVRTSFIEDDHYDKMYVSAGPEFNSVTLYLYVFGNYRVHNFIYNIDISKLNDMFIFKKDIITELQLTKNIYFSNNSVEVEHIYASEQKNNSENDLICNLPYEKKITLCKLFFDQPLYKDEKQITLNKSAAYIYSLNCVTKPVYKLTKMHIKLQDKQRMYQCPGRNKTTLSENNLLMDINVKKFFLSTGPRRNSIFVYIYRVSSKKYNYVEKHQISDIMENVNIARLKSTIITQEEVKKESATTYEKICNLMNVTENLYYSELLNIIEQLKEHEPITKNDKFNKFLELRQSIENEKNEKLQKEVNELESKLNLEYNKEINDKNMFTMNTIIQKLSVQSIRIFEKLNHSTFGPQMYKRIIENIQANLKSGTSILHLDKSRSNKHELATSRSKELKKKTLLNVCKTKESIKISIKLSNQAQKLIKNMEKYAQDEALRKIDNLVEQITSGEGRDKKTHEKKKTITKQKKKKY